MRVANGVLLLMLSVVPWTASGASPARPAATARAPAAEAALPLVEVPATAGTSDTFVVFVSGDGGWAAIDKSMAAVFAARGMPVVGLNALQYFWSKKSADVAGRDLRRIIEQYSARWQKKRVILVGYSRGADVLPAMASRLSAEILSRVRLVALLGPSPKAQFEFHMSDWLHDPSGGEPVRPELERMRGTPVLCLWGEEDTDSLCRGLTMPNVRVVTLRGGHHFDGAYENLARIVLEKIE